MQATNEKQEKQKEAFGTSVAKEVEVRHGYKHNPVGFAQKKITRKIRFADYVRRVKRLDLDPWQENFCDRLEKAFFERDIKAMKAAIAVMPQAGKSIIISQAFPAYILGHDPFHRIVLACYNLTRSRKHAQAVQGILRSAAHIAIFSEKDGHIPTVCSDKAFSTFARLSNYDGQDSFTAASLLTGLTGIGFDTLIIDDPYKDRNEAFSALLREKSWNFYQDTAQMRGGDFGNIFLMFHRYHQDDIGGRALATKEFEYWHYDAQFIGDYKDDETGISYPDAYPRAYGEYLSPRRSPGWYEKQKRIPSVWNSQFQQRPTGESGNMFDVKKIVELEREPDPKQFAFITRSWDNAYTSDGGDFTVGVKQGIRFDESVHIFDVVREQVNTGDRLLLQERTAKADGKLVLISHPVDPAAGKDTAFQFEQKFTELGYTVELMPTTENKEIRAHPFSVAVNQGKVSVMKNSPFLTEFIKELKFFPNSTYKDQTDATGDGYRVNYNKLRRGLVVKTYSENRNLLGWSRFAQRFGKAIPSHWEIYAALKVSNDSSKPSGAILVARAAENAHIGEAVFVLAEFKLLSGSFTKVIDWLKTATGYFVQKTRNADGIEQPRAIPLLWMSDKSADEIKTACKKLNVRLGMFDGTIETGVPEMNWYFGEDETRKHPFYPEQTATRIYLNVTDSQIDNPTDEFGLISLRQELGTWTYNQKSEPQEFGGVVADCLKMILADFKPRAIQLTSYEKASQTIAEASPHLLPENIERETDDQVKQQRRLQRSIKLNKLMDDNEKGTKLGGEFMEFLEGKGEI